LLERFGDANNIKRMII